MRDAGGRVLALSLHDWRVVRNDKMSLILLSIMPLASMAFFKTAMRAALFQEGYLHVNGAEQVVRHGVIMRKISYGTHSVAGSRFVERMLTVHATLRRQRRNILGFMRAACTAALRSHPAPSILPIEASVIRVFLPEIL